MKKRIVYTMYLRWYFPSYMLFLSALLFGVAIFAPIPTFGVWLVATMACALLAAWVMCSYDAPKGVGANGARELLRIARKDRDFYIDSVKRAPSGDLLWDYTAHYFDHGDRKEIHFRLSAYIALGTFTLIKEEPDKLVLLVKKHADEVQPTIFRFQVGFGGRLRYVYKLEESSKKLEEV